MKVSVENGVITRISKALMAEESYGCSIDVYRIAASHASLLVEKCVESSRLREIATSGRKLC